MNLSSPDTVKNSGVRKLTEHELSVIASCKERFCEKYQESTVRDCFASGETLQAMRKEIIAATREAIKNDTTGKAKKKKKEERGWLHFINGKLPIGPRHVQRLVLIFEQLNYLHEDEVQAKRLPPAADALYELATIKKDSNEAMVLKALESLNGDFRNAKAKIQKFKSDQGLDATETGAGQSAAAAESQPDELIVGEDVNAALEQMKEEGQPKFDAVYARISPEGFESAEEFKAFFDSFYDNIAALLHGDGFLFLALPKEYRRVALGCALNFPELQWDIEHGRATREDPLGLETAVPTLVRLPKGELLPKTDELPRRGKVTMIDRYVRTGSRVLIPSLTTESDSILSQLEQRKCHYTLIAKSQQQPEKLKQRGKAEKGKGTKAPQPPLTATL